MGACREKNDPVWIMSDSLSGDEKFGLFELIHTAVICTFVPLDARKNESRSSVDIARRTLAR